MSNHKATLRRLNEALNSGDLERISTTIDEVFDPNVRVATPLPIDATGAQSLKQIWTTLLRAYPDLHVTVEDMFGEGDRVVARNSVTGTQRGEYLGIAPTGKAVAYDEMFILRFVEDRIVEMWGVVDLHSQLRQLGAIPSPP